ncbi:MAG: PilZ domain-containing protein [Deltaproteobacteria bacterium]|nr:PilZ domain-containing protein [Deltaproteobacteria bacterium]
MERRTSRRRLHRAPVRLYLDGDKGAGFELESSDLSAGGVFIEADLLLSLGERVAFEVPVGAGYLKGYGRVVRVRSEGEPGVVIRFTGMGDEQLSQVGLA